MGFFDESSDSDDDQPSSHQQLKPAKEGEEDPLDAYMNNLQQQATNQPSSDHPHVSLVERLDLDQELEESEPASSVASVPKQQASQTKNGSGTNESSLSHLFTKGGVGGSVVPPVAKQAASSVFEKVFWTHVDSFSGKSWRQQHEIVLHNVKNKQQWTVDPILNFSDANTVLGQPLVQYLSTTFETPTLVQAQTFPVVWLGRDALITAATGQGKTLAYVLGLMPQVASQTLQPSETGPLALILVPTRELATQVHKQIVAIQSYTSRSIKSRVVIGGVGKYVLYTELKRSHVDIVVATPGRLLDVVSDKKGLCLSRVTFVVLDEADKMLHMGFEKQVRSILSTIQPTRQTLLLSATLSKKVEQVATAWLKNPVRISVGKTGEASHNVTQHVMVLPNEAAKQTFMVEMLPTFRDLGRSIVFVNTKDGCETLALLLQRSTNVSIRTLHGDKHQADRFAAVKAFTKHDVSVLVATDLAARGLDIPNVSTVINFDPAKDLDSHVHRVGRAGRLSQNVQQAGSAYTLLVPKNADFAHVLRNAFEREGRTVSPELQALANQSRKAGNVEVRTHSNKAGLGYSNPFEDAPPPKRSRWS